MAYISVDVAIEIEEHLDEVSTEDLIKELQSRKKDSTIYNMVHVYKLFGADSVRDVIKVEAFIEKYKDIPESELDAFLNQY